MAVMRLDKKSAKQEEGEGAVRQEPPWLCFQRT